MIDTLTLASGVMRIRFTTAWLLRPCRMGIILATTFLLSGCLTTPIVEVRDQQYSTWEQVVLLSTSEIENNLVYYHALCRNGHWMKPATEDAKQRQMVWGKQLNARTFRVDGWIDFIPMGAGRTQIVAHATPAMRPTISAFVSIVADPNTCRQW